MAAAKDFESFYNEFLQPSLSELRERYRASKRWLYVTIVAFLVGIVYFIISSSASLSDSNSLTPLIIFFVIALVGLGLHINSRDDYVFSFKENIIKKIVDFIYPGIVYEHGKHINSKHYKNSCLARRIYSDINGDDFFKGQYKSVHFTCSELDTFDRGEGIFSGLFFIANISPFYNAGTYIWSKGNEQIAGSIYTEHYRFFPMPKAYHMEMGDETFDKKFTVYSTYPSQAREILNAKRMQQMINFYSKLNKDISFSFVGGYCYVAFPSTKKLFEAGKDPGNKENIKEHFMNILTFLSFIDKLMLDEMI